MDYQDFTIDIRSSDGGGFEATVVEAPRRDNPRVRFTDPVAREEIAILLAAFETPGEALRDGPPPGVSPRGMGEQLWEALFRDGLGDLFKTCRSGLCARGPGLRLRLRFRADDPAAEYLAALPWEWLWDHATGLHLATSLGTPIVRELAAPRLQHPLDVPPPLRILVVDAAPATMRKLDLKLEIERMTEALEPLMESGEVELLRLETPTLEAMREALRTEDIHVLHFMGHGGYHAATGYGALFFVGEDGAEKDQVDGLMLAAFLQWVPSLRLVVLNACKTARQGRLTGSPVYQGVASAVLRQTEVPAVIANQHSISDHAAIAFSRAFYRSLAEGRGVDESLTEARLLLWARTSEWATPVLYLSSADGRLFSMPRKAKRATAIRIPTRRQRDETPIRLGIRTLTGLEGDMASRNDEILDLTHLFEKRYIRRKEDWQERVFPELRAFLRERVDQRRPLLLDFAAHASVAFAAGWLLEPKSGLDVTVRQRMYNQPELEWHPEDGTEPEGAPWLERQDVTIFPEAPDVALALSVSQATVAAEARVFIENAKLPVSRLVDAVIAPEPGPKSVRGGAHALRLAQALIHRARLRQPHERGGATHVFAAAPNALVFYLGQLASSLERVVLYEYPFRAPGAFGVYQRSIELPPPGEAQRIPEGFAG